MKIGKNNLKSPYMPVAAEVLSSEMVTAREIFLRLRPADTSFMGYAAGQFFMAGLPGYGEGPFSVASAPGSDVLELCIRSVGNLTEAIHSLMPGDKLWIRGPFGRGFDLKAFENSDILFIAGGIGIVPMRSLVEAVIAGKGRFGRLTLVYGSKTPEEILFGKELEEWNGAGCDVRLTIDKPHPAWGGTTGLVTTIIPGLELDAKRTRVVIIGPPVMYRFVLMSLKKFDMAPENIFLSLERRMKCGVGKCGHCQINGCYVCQEGPVFSLSGLAGLDEAL